MFIKIKTILVLVMFLRFMSGQDYPNCPEPNLIGNGNCDYGEWELFDWAGGTNNEECGYDGGDCCPSTNPSLDYEFNTGEDGCGTYVSGGSFLAPTMNWVEYCRGPDEECNPEPDLIGTWKIAPIAGAFKVGGSPDDGSYWSNTEADVVIRACLFDDEYVFNSNGSFQNLFSMNTWNETWQAGVLIDGCGAPIEPHDGSITSSYFYDADASTLTLNGEGAFLVLTKAITDGELSVEGTEVPSSRTYSIYPSGEPNMLMLVINTRPVGDDNRAFWTFRIVNSQWGTEETETIDITFNLDMNSVESVNQDGVSIAGGDEFGYPGDHQMTDEDNDGIYTVTITKPVNSSSNYIYINGISNWTQKENIEGQDCSDADNYNDRYLEWGTDDLEVNACFSICGEGNCNTILSNDSRTETLPEYFNIVQNYPNPFNPTTQINYDLPENTFVSIIIYDVMGREIKSLLNDNQDAGYRSLQWNATNNLGQPVSAGMYIYTIQAGEFRSTKKMVLLK